MKNLRKELLTLILNKLGKDRISSQTTNEFIQINKVIEFYEKIKKMNQ